MPTWRSRARRLPGGACRAGARARVGIECAGVVSAVGQGVHDLAPGDLVVLPAGGCWAEAGRAGKVLLTMP